MILERLIALNARQTKEQTRAFVSSKTTMHLLSHLD